ncbi:MAG TPA: FHA domain-containing protein, partial [Cellvibrionaceae bacterium]
MLKIRFKNKKYSAVWLVEPKVTIGRGRDNQVVVSAPNVADQHLEILVDRDNLTLVNLAPDSPVMVNGKPGTDKQLLVAGDTITLADIDLEIIDPKQDLSAKPAPKPEQQTSPRIPKATGWALKANHSALQNRVFPLKLKNTIGRSSECDICVAAAHLSRRHADLTIVEGVLFVKDLGSANGTYLNGKRITEARIKRGDELRFDTLSFGVIGPADDMAKTTVRSATGQPKTGAVKKPVPARVIQEYSAEADKPAAAGNPRYATGGLIVLA